MANTYKHYGIDVIKQYVTSFRTSLKKESIEYIDLAISPDVDVVMYHFNGSKRYALIRPQSLPDDYAETVYITSQTPDDCDWDKLADDVDAQSKGAESMQRSTRAKMLLDAAFKAAYASVPDVEDVFNSVPVDEDELIPSVQRFLAAHGVSPKDLLQAEHYDVNEEILNKLIK